MKNNKSKKTTKKQTTSSKNKSTLRPNNTQNSNKFNTQIYNNSSYEFDTKIYGEPNDSRDTKNAGNQNTRKLNTAGAKGNSKFSKAPKTKNKKEKKKKGKFSSKHPKLALTIKLSFVAILVFFVIAAGIVVGMLYGMWGQDFEISEEELKVAGNSILYDSEGNVLAELKGDENRKIIKLEEMAEYLPKAYVAIEDERFYEHDGVDYKRTGAAIATYILHRGSSS